MFSAPYTTIQINRPLVDQQISSLRQITPSSNTQTVLFAGMYNILGVTYASIKMILRWVSRLLRWAKNFKRRHRNSLTRPSHGPKILSKQTILGSTLASTSPGMLIAAATGFITYFNDEVASAIQSVDLSNTPLSPISGLQEALVRSLEGNYCFTWI